MTWEFKGHFPRKQVPVLKFSTFSEESEVRVKRDGDTSLHLVERKRIEQKDKYLEKMQRNECQGF